MKALSVEDVTLWPHYARMCLDMCNMSSVWDIMDQIVFMFRESFGLIISIHIFKNLLKCNHVKLVKEEFHITGGGTVW